MKNHLQDLIEKRVLERRVRLANRALNVVNNMLPTNKVNILRLESDDVDEENTFIIITDKTPSLHVSVTPASLDCNMITWKSLLGKKKEVNLVVNNAEVTHLTRSVKVYQPVREEVSNTKENPHPWVIGEDDIPEDPVLTQMKKTNANISIWGLLCLSKKHRDALSKSLSQVVVAIDKSPSALTQMIRIIHFGNVIVFSELDIPKAGTKHTDALNITVDYGNTRIHKVLIDNRSSINICPSKTMAMVGINPID